MNGARTTQGPAATEAYRLGMVCSIVLGATAVGILYWIGSLTPAVSYAMVALGPIYLVFSAVVLSVWLDGVKDTTALRPVSHLEESE